MKKLFFYLLPIVCLAFFSCQKEVSDTLAGTETGGDGNTDSGTYLPLTKDTHWKYQDSATGAQTTLLVLDETKVIEGRSYTAVLGSNAFLTDTAYMTQEDHDYYNYTNTSNGTSSGIFLFHYLNDTAAVGSNWEYLAGQVNGLPAYFKTTIVERNLTRTVQNKTFSDVIHTRMELSYDIQGQRTQAGTYEYYIAKGVGIIQVQSTLVTAGSQKSTDNELVEYEIK